jgi:hypothetical protein
LVAEGQGAMTRCRSCERAEAAILACEAAGADYDASAEADIACTCDYSPPGYTPDASEVATTHERVLTLMGYTVRDRPAVCGHTVRALDHEHRGSCYTCLRYVDLAPWVMNRPGSETSENAGAKR